MLASLADLVGKAERREDVSVIVLEGAGRAFSAGVDLKVLQGVRPVAGRIGDSFDAPAKKSCLVLRKAPVPVIAKVPLFDLTRDPDPVMTTPF